MKALVARVYRHWGRIATSFAELPHLTAGDARQWIILDESAECISNCLKENRGCIVFSGHLGNWEVMGAFESLRGVPVSFVVTTQRNKLVERMLDDYRRRNGIEIIKRKQAVRGVLDALKRNRAVAILIDQDAHEDGAFVPFFGKLASTPRGPAIFHLRTGAPLVFAHSTWLPGDRHRIRYNRLIPPAAADADELTAMMTAQLEQAIRETPEQWLWMHRRWKTSPSAS